ncbi:MAG TPA: hypothetical protein VJH96_01460 [Patescibacteria group bacterium]|nr:hypothetical protein [Patescibacteria group bacterium]
MNAKEAFSSRPSSERILLPSLYTVSYPTVGKELAKSHDPLFLAKVNGAISFIHVEIGGEYLLTRLTTEELFGLKKALHDWDTAPAQQRLHALINYIPSVRETQKILEKYCADHYLRTRNPIPERQWERLAEIIMLYHGSDFSFLNAEFKKKPEEVTVKQSSRSRAKTVSAEIYLIDDIQTKRKPQELQVIVVNMQNMLVWYAQTVASVLTPQERRSLQIDDAIKTLSMVYHDFSKNHDLQLGEIIAAKRLVRSVSRTVQKSPSHIRERISFVKAP